MNLLNSGYPTAVLLAVHPLNKNDMDCRLCFISGL